MLRGTKNKTAKRKSTKVAKRTTKKKVAKRRNPDVSIRDIEDFLKKDMSTNPNHYPPSSAYRAIDHFNLNINADSIKDNWVIELAWEVSERLKYNKDRTMARKSKKGTNYGSLGVGNSPFKK